MAEETDHSEEESSEIIEATVNEEENNTEENSDSEKEEEELSEEVKDSSAEENNSLLEENEPVNEENESSREEEPEWITEVWVNPEYEDLLSGDYSAEEDQTPPPLYLRAATYTTVEDAANQLLGQMSYRSEKITIQVRIPEETAENWSALAKQILYKAYEHGDNPKGGDYLYWHVKSVTLGYSSSEPVDGYWQGSISYKTIFLDNYDQEEQVDIKLAELLQSMDFGSGTELEKATAVFTWLCNNVTYDYVHLEDKTYLLKHSAYAALIDRTAVCQGYALLFYRMALELGLDARIITNSTHAWVIVRIDSYYYLCDPTWDAEAYCGAKYKYYMRGEPNFTGHTPDEKYTTEPFISDFPLSQIDLSYPENMKIEAQKIYTVPESLTLEGVGDQKTVEVIVEPADAYDKSFEAKNNNSTAAGAYWNFNSKKEKNYKGTISAKQNGEGSFTLTLSNHKDSFTLPVKVQNTEKYSVTVVNPYTDGTAGVNYLALYSGSLSDEEILSDVKGTQENSLYKASVTSGSKIWFDDAVPEGDYKLAAVKKGYLPIVITAEISEGKRSSEIILRAFGDVNHDKAVNVTDIIYLRDLILNMGSASSMNEEDRLAADIDQDGKPTVSDIIYVRDRILGMKNEAYERK